MSIRLIRFARAVGGALVGCALYFAMVMNYACVSVCDIAGMQAHCNYAFMNNLFIKVSCKSVGHSQGARARAQLAKDINGI